MLAPLRPVRHAEEGCGLCAFCGFPQQPFAAQLFNSLSARNQAGRRGQGGGRGGQRGRGGRLQLRPSPLARWLGGTAAAANAAAAAAVTPAAAQPLSYSGKRISRVAAREIASERRGYAARIALGGQAHVA